MYKKDIKVGLEFRYIGEVSVHYTRNKIYKVTQVFNLNFCLQDNNSENHTWAYDEFFDKKFQLASISREYTSSKEDVSDAVRDFEINSRIQCYYNGTDAWIDCIYLGVNTTEDGAFKVCFINEDDEIDFETTEYVGEIRKLQKTVIPYNELIDLVRRFIKDDGATISLDELEHDLNKIVGE